MRGHAARWAAALLLVGHVAAAQAALRGPWDAAPAIMARTAHFSCPSPPDLPAVIVASDYYSDAAHSVIDQPRWRAYEQAIAPWHKAAGALDAMADRYRNGAGTGVAACAAGWLGHFARDGAMTGTMATNQASYVQGWMLGSMAIAWLKLRADPAIPDGQRQWITAWMARVAERTEAYFTPRAAKIDGRNNHRAWAGLAVMSAGIAANRHDLFDWGADSFAILAAQVATDGTLPLEMGRRSRALHYHLFAAAPMVTMAALAEPNGRDLYGAQDGALHRLMAAVLRGIGDPGWFTVRAGAPQEPTTEDVHGIGWARPFAHRFPDAALAALLAQTRPGGNLYLGGAPPP